MSERENEEMMNLMDSTLPFAELYERSKDDRAIIVGSEVREVIGAYRRCLRSLGELERASTPPVPQEGPSVECLCGGYISENGYCPVHMPKPVYKSFAEWWEPIANQFDGGIFCFIFKGEFLLKDARKIAELSFDAGRSIDRTVPQPSRTDYLTPSELNALEELRGKATPGIWECREVEGNAAIAHPLGWVLEGSFEQNLACSRYIASLHPITVGKMIEEIRQSRSGQKP